MYHTWNVVSSGQEYPLTHNNDVPYVGAVFEASHAGRWVITPVRRWLYRGASPYQDIAVGVVPYLGRCLFLDGWLQLAEADEYIYHEHLVLPALMAHPAPRRILILGGGDGLALREVLLHTRVEHVVMVDLDAQVVEVCKTYCGDMQQGALDDPRFHLVIGDAREYLRDTSEHFDVIFVDLVDLMPGTLPLFEDVFSRVRRVLLPDSLVVVHGPDPGPPLYEGLFMVSIMQRHFPHVAWYKAFITSFGETWSFAVGSNTENIALLPPRTWQERSRQLRRPPRSLVPEALPALMLHPPEEEERLRSLSAGAEIASLEDWPAVLLSREAVKVLQQLVLNPHPDNVE